MSGTTSKPLLEISPTVDDFEIAAARAVLDIIMTAVQERGRCLIGLSGGRTPRGVYRRLADLLVTQSVDMSQAYLVLVDERMVPPDDPDSNYGMIQRELISRIHIPTLHICRIRSERKAGLAAHDYEQQLQTVLPQFAGRCDLILLGVGEDGHTASLFPGSPVLREQQNRVCAVFVPRLGNWRVTLTLPIINCARTVIFLVTGGQKAAIVGKILVSKESSEDIPATLVRPDPGTLRWMLDAEAASQLPLMSDTAFI